MTRLSLATVVAALLLALLSAALAISARLRIDALAADYHAYRRGADQPWLPQTIRYLIEGDDAHVTVETPMWPGESLDAWLARQDMALAAWRDKHGRPVDAVDGR